MNASVFWAVATIMVVFATAVLVVPLFWSERAAEDVKRRRRQRLALGASVVSMPLAALGLYAMLGSPQLIADSAAPVAAAASPHPGAMGAASAGEAGDLGAATARLEAKLAANPDDPAGWQLLAQSYEFAGRSEDAARARARAGGGNVAVPASAAQIAPGGLAAVAAALTPGGASDAADRNRTDIAALRARVQSVPQDRDAWGTLAELLRRARDFPAAVAAFERRAALGGMTADLWADYADAQGAAAGGLDASSARYIDAALKLDPRHTKALWLLGSYQTERGDHRGAVATWQKLASVLPADSSDARIIAANLAEARAALAGAGAAVVAQSAVVRGEVNVEPRWRTQLQPGATLFIVAKSVDQPGPPLAVYRTQVGSWPARFQLDDSLSMLPGRQLSGFSKVIIEARISRSGRAEPQAGDLRGVSPQIDPRNPAPVRLLISERIG